MTRLEASTHRPGGAFAVSARLAPARLRALGARILPAVSGCAGTGGRRRWAAAATLVAALPATPVAVAVLGPGSHPLAVIGAGAVVLAGLAAWLGPAAWPGMPAPLAVERVMVTAMIAWAAAVDAAVAGTAVHGGGAAFGPAGIGASAGVYVGASAWSVKAADEVWWRWPVACSSAAAAWIAVQAATR